MAVDEAEAQRLLRLDGAAGEHQVQGPGPAFLSFVNYLVPAWAVIAGALFLDEALSSWAYAGLALILSGIALSEAGPAIKGRFRRLGRTAAQRIAREQS